MINGVLSALDKLFEHIELIHLISDKTMLLYGYSTPSVTSKKERQIITDSIINVNKQSELTNHVESEYCRSDKRGSP